LWKSKSSSFSAKPRAPGFELPSPRWLPDQTTIAGARQLGGSEAAALTCNVSCGVEADWLLAVADS